MCDVESGTINVKRCCSDNLASKKNSKKILTLNSLIIADYLLKQNASNTAPHLNPVFTRTRID